MEEKSNYTYILTCADGTLYCGWTNHLEQRVKAHNEGRGAKYTKARRPVVLSYWEAFDTKEEAMRREYAIKRLRRGEKLRLMSPGFIYQGGQYKNSHDEDSCRWAAVFC